MPLLRPCGSAVPVALPSFWCLGRFMLCQDFWFWFFERRTCLSCDAVDKGIPLVVCPCVADVLWARAAAAAAAGAAAAE
jgi:hypothetical protein